ncbi:MAG: PAS domain S-box protein, partial [Actinobacteria bacterium]|nr:PAS domain S-box protein [Actinomycetota bacterium]
MSLLQSPYVYLMLLAAGVSLVVALMILSRHSAPGAVPLAILNLCGAVWALTTAFTLASPNYATAVLWHKVQLLGMEPISVAWIVFVLAYLGRDRWLRPGRLAALGVVTAATISLGFTNEFHHLLWQQLTFFPGTPSVLRENPGLWWWVATFYDYGLLLLGIVLLAMRFWRQEGIYRRQTALVIVACLIPLAIDSVYTMTIGTKTEINLAPLAFTCVGALLSFAFFRFKLFEVTPIARDFILENMTDALIVLDDRGRVTEMNGAAETLLKTKARTATGKQFREVCTGVPELSELPAGWQATSVELSVGSGHDARTYHALVSPVPSKRGELKGKIVVLRDITELKQAEIAVREARDQLELRVQERTAELKVANEGLRRSQAQLAQLLSTSPAVIYTGRFEPGFPLTFVSDNVQTQLGLTSAEVLTPSFWRDHVHPDDLKVLTGKEAVLGSSGVAAQQYRLRCPAGERVIHDDMRLL